jgi:hypothetical protein
MRLQDESQIGVSAHEVRINLQSRPEMEFGFLPFSLLKEQGSEVVFRVMKVIVLKTAITPTRGSFS